MVLNQRTVTVYTADDYIGQDQKDTAYSTLQESRS